MGKIAPDGQIEMQFPQSMHSSGLMNNWVTVSAPASSLMG
jgi:hypothetical protein